MKICYNNKQSIGEKMIERKCAKFREKGFSRSKENGENEQTETAILCTTLYRKPMQLNNFDRILYQPRHRKYSQGFYP